MIDRAHIKMIAKLRDASRTRLAVSLFVFLAFFLQSYVCQTHIHIPQTARAITGTGAGAKGVSGKSLAGSQGGDHDKYPANEDPANCPLCQEVLHSGSFVAPALIAVLLPMTFAVVRWIASTAPIHILASAHDWRGRGPPIL